MGREALLLYVEKKMDKFIFEIFTQVKENGIDKTYTKENIKQVYENIVKGSMYLIYDKITLKV